MKSSVFFLGALLLQITAFAQYTGSNSSAISEIGLYAQRNKSKTNFDPSETKGSPYVTDNFLPGTVKIIHKNAEIACYLRYNAFEEFFELRQNPQDTEVVTLVKTEPVEVVYVQTLYKIESCIDQNNLEIKTYLTSLYQGEKTSLYLRPKKRFKEGKKAKTGFETDIKPAFLDDNEYYVKMDGRILYLPLNKKSIIEFFKGHENEIKSHLKTNKIDLENEQDLINLIQYYESLI